MKTKQLRIMGVTSINIKGFNLEYSSITDYHNGCNTGEYYFRKEIYRANETIEPQYRLTYYFTAPNGKTQTATMEGSTLLKALSCIEDFKRTHKSLLYRRYWK